MSFPKVKNAIAYRRRFLPLAENDPAIPPLYLGFLSLFFLVCEGTSPSRQMISKETVDRSLIYLKDFSRLQEQEPLQEVVEGDEDAEGAMEIRHDAFAGEKKELFR